ncbi:MAG TPA: PSD1 and planctomycete cytochrome C domain-containing protein [Pirellulales bacterium]
MIRHRWSSKSLGLWLVWLLAPDAIADPNPAPTLAPNAAAGPAAAVGTNFNDGSQFQPEFPEQFFRNAAPGNWPVPAISAADLAHGIMPVVISGTVHPLSGGATKLTDGSGAQTDDNPATCFVFDNGVPLGQFRLSLAQAEPIGQINLYSWHRNASNGGIRAPLKVDVYASLGDAPGFNVDDPHGPGYVLLARIDTARPGGVNAQSGQHGASVFPVEGQTLGRFQHFVFEVLPPIDGVVHTFITEVDILRAAGPAASAAATPAGKHFDQQIAGLLARNCLNCHNPTDGKGGLDLTRAETATAGGDSGVVLVPGKPAESLLLARVMADEMPPKHPLDENEKVLLREWIAGGAGWGSSPIDRFRFSSAGRAGYDWWALQPLVAPHLPAIQDGQWPINAIDHFVLAKLEAAQLAPAPAADRPALIRRLTFDLIGLPPTPEEVEAFVGDSASDAYERLVDRLLASPHYGERWGRHWLDVVRFAESQGFERNKYYPGAWRYRDWVIQAVNDDLPYDEFVRMQLAGDVLHPDDPAALVAAGYLVITPHDYVGVTHGSAAMKANSREDELENLVGNIGQTFLGMTVNCARCHDHKFDPLKQTEYFQLAAAVGGLVRSDRALPVPAAPAAGSAEQESHAAARKSMEDTLAGLLGSDGEELIRQARAEAIAAAERAVEAARAVLAEAEKAAASNDANLRSVAEDRRRDLQSAEDALLLVRNPYACSALDKLRERVPLDRRAEYNRAVTELSRLETYDLRRMGGTAQGFVSAPPQYFRVLARGNFRDPREVVAADGLECVSGLSADWNLPAGAPETERRLRLAAWATDPRNPLPARVIVNRLWHYHFGVGLVDTPNDFGFGGGRPSHGELLDWLANELITNGWSLKKIQRAIVLSATYRQSAKFNPQAAQSDAAGRLLWRKTPLRLDAEEIRDAVLAVSGELNVRMGGPSYRDLQMTTVNSNTTFTPAETIDSTTNRRTVYRMIPRTAPAPLLETLDCADPAVATPRRSVTTTPLQALALLNNSLVRKSATAFANRVRQEAGDPVDRQIDRAYRLAFARGATDQERESAARFVAENGLEELCLVIFNSNEFLYVD